MIIYNLFPLLAGPFTGWNKHYERIADMGFDWVFVNPVQYPGMSGSLYAVRDYDRFNPLLLDEESSLAPEAQVRRAVEDARSNGLRMMIDLVVNHCAVDADLVREHRGWFAWEGDEPVHPCCDENGQRVVWGDLAKFDYEHTSDREGLYQFILQTVEFLIGLGFEGFRCDAAYQVPGDIWRRLIAEVRERHDGIIFAAETLGCTADQTRDTAAAGFDYVFNSCKWWDFKSAWLMEQYNLIREIAPSIGFPESHDTERLYTELQGNINGVKQRCLFASFFSAGVMIPMGFEYGFRNKLHVVETRPGDWEETGVDISGFIRSINRVKAAYDVFGEECPANIMQADNPHVLLMWRGSTRSRQEALLILNKDIWSNQHFHAPDLGHLVQSGAPLKCVFPDTGLEYIPQPFVYDLRPGEGLVMIAER